jgi:hypothetical protein
MSCCGQKRQAWREYHAVKVTVLPPPTGALQNAVIVNHLGKTSLVIRGAVTGQTYLFAGGGIGLTVDERDVPALLASGQFVLRP